MRSLQCPAPAHEIKMYHIAATGEILWTIQPLFESCHPERAARLGGGNWLNAMLSARPFLPLFSLRSYFAYLEKMGTPLERLFSKIFVAAHAPAWAVTRNKVQPWMLTFFKRPSHPIALTVSGLFSTKAAATTTRQPTSSGRDLGRYPWGCGSHFQFGLPFGALGFLQEPWMALSGQAACLHECLF